MTYRVHRLNLRMTKDEERLEQFLNGLEGELVAVIPNVNTVLGEWCHVDFLLIVERCTPTAAATEGRQCAL